MRRRFLRTFALAALVVFAVPLMIALGLTATIGGWAAVAVVVVFWLSLLVVGAIIGRFALRSFHPVRRVIDVTDRLAGGDYSARVEPTGRTTPLQPVVESVNAMAERLERSDELRTRLLADVSHELRTPLTVVRGSLEAIADGVRPFDQDDIRSLLGDIDVMERLLDDLRTMSAAEAGRLRLHREPVDLAGLAREVIDGFRAGAIEARLELEAGASGEVDLDPIRMHQVLTNLIANALRAAPAGIVTVEIETDVAGPAGDRWVVVRVVDDGVGMDEVERTQAFERFHKGADSTGSGLGLAISRDLVEAHGGTIELESQVGLGTTVIVRLPMS